MVNAGASGEAEAGEKSDWQNAVAAQPHRWMLEAEVLGL